MLTTIALDSLGGGFCSLVINQDDRQIEIQRVLVRVSVEESANGEPAILIEFPNIRSDDVSKALFEAFGNLGKGTF